MTDDLQNPETAMLMLKRAKRMQGTKPKKHSDSIRVCVNSIVTSFASGLIGHLHTSIQQDPRVQIERIPSPPSEKFTWAEESSVVRRPEARCVLIHAMQYHAVGHNPCHDRGVKAAEPRTITLPSQPRGSHGQRAADGRGHVGAQPQNPKW